MKIFDWLMENEKKLWWVILGFFLAWIIDILIR